MAAPELEENLGDAAAAAHARRPGIRAVMVMRPLGAQAGRDSMAAKGNSGFCGAERDAGML
jgi:hypothetical protein